jgi:hypothetical protein
MSLLTIATAALSEISGFDVPSSFYGNQNLTAKLCVALSNREGKTLEKELRWQELITEYTFTTVSGTATYALPSDFRAFANMSQWDRTNFWRLSGPVPSVIWQWLKSGIAVAATTTRYFMIRGNYFTLYPTPSTTGDTIAFDYYSKSWVTKQADSLNTTEWTTDNDTSRIDEDLLTMGLKWRFLQAKGMPYQPEYAEYESIKDALKEDNGGRGIISLNGCKPMQDGGNLPDTGIGQ